MQKLIDKLRTFARERDWEKFHSPKNLAMALSVEASEIVELFQWMTEEESYNLDPQRVQALKEEIGDVMIYLTNLADKFGIDPIDAAKEKVLLNERRYPSDMVRGKAMKYNEY